MPLGYARKLCARAFLFAISCGFVSGFLSQARAGVPNYYLHLWQTEDGLPQNAVTAIVQTRDGYVWVGTYSGLARFDGVHFTRFDSGNTPEMRSSRVTSLFEDSEGALWIGHETGDVTRYQTGHFSSVQMPPGWAGRKILGMIADPAGDLWAMGTFGSIARLRDGLVLNPDASSNEEGASLARDKAGTVWLVSNGRVSHLQGKLLVPLDVQNDDVEHTAQGVCASSDGGVWIAGGGRMRKWRENDWRQDRGRTPWGLGRTTAFLETRSGTLAVGTVDAGIDLMPPDGRVVCYNRTNGFPSDWVRALCEDREGNLWVGTGNGLAVLRAGKVATVNAPDQWQGRAVLSVSPGQSGTLWVGTEGAGLYRYRNGDWTRYAGEANLGNTFVWSVAESPQGDLFAGTWGGGLLVRNGDRFESARGLENLNVPMPALFHSRNGSTWIGTGTGLLHYSSGRSELYGEKEGLAFPDVRAVVEDEAGTVWFGMFGGGLGRLVHGTLRQFRKADGLSSDFVQCLQVDDPGVLWAGTAGGGLNRFKDGRFAVVDAAHGLRNDVICHIEDDRHGNYWMSSHGGIMCVSKEELNRCADRQLASVHCRTLDRGDGLPTLECSGGLQPAGCRTPDGKLWFPTSKGLVVLDPAEVRTNPYPPPVLIEEWLVNGRPRTNSADGAAATVCQLLPGQNRFEFRYTALSFVAPEKVLFKCRLEGLEPDWVDAGLKRTANYNYIPPGDYTFHVTACNNDGVWNEAGASLSFRVAPHFWQTWWFRAVSALGLLAAASGGVWFDTRRRMRRKLERSERQRAIEHERARIARDIHDDLGSRLTRITMLSESARGELENPAQAGADIDRIYDTARDLTRAMDEIVWAVNPKHDTLESLVNYLEKFTQDFLAPAGLRCRLDMPVRFPPWPLTAEVRHNLFLAFKEALNNVVKHAAASEAKFTLALEPSGFALTLEDNGRGFLVDAASRGEAASPDRLSGGNGLENMRRRLEEIGGGFSIHSEPGKGTKVVFGVRLKTPA